MRISLVFATTSYYYTTSPHIARLIKPKG